MTPMKTQADLRKQRSDAEREAALGWALADPLCQLILSALGERPASGIELAESLGEDREKVAYRIRKLAGNYGDAPLIELVTTDKSDDRRRNLYRAIARGVLDTAASEGLSRLTREGLSAAAINTINDDIRASIEAGQLDRYPSRTLLRLAGTVDEVGLEEIGELLERSLKDVEEIEVQSDRRLAASGGRAIKIQTALIAIPRG